MFKKTENNNRFFYGQCGDWEGVSMAPTPMEACRQMVKGSRKFFPDGKRDTDVMVVMDVRDEMESVETQNVSAFTMESMRGES